MSRVAVLRGGRHIRSLFKVGARQAGAIGKVNDKGAVAKEGVGAFIERDERVRVFDVERVTGNLAVLAAQITNLASGGLGGIAGRLLATVGRVQMSTSRSAVAVRSRVDVNVVR